MNNGEQFFNTSGGGGYAIERSLRFNSSDSAYLSRTPASAGNRKTWTWAGWVKRSGFSQNHDIFSARSGDTTGGLDVGTAIRLRDVDRLQVYDFRNGAYVFQVETSAVYRDPSAWAHIVVAVDTTQATSSDRVRIYINGAEVTSLNTANYPAQDSTPEINSTQQHAIGGGFTDASTSPSFLLNGYLADIHFIDGQALDPTSFGEFDDNGIWQPIAYTGTYGTNGFHLPFSDNSTAAALGTDTSGNGNDWTVNNLSVTAGAGNDSLVDVPTNGSEVDTGSGGQVRGNYCTWNPLDRTVSSPIPLANGNLDVSGSGSGSEWSPVNGTVGMSSGKWYWEVTGSGTLYAYIGIAAVLPQDGTGERWPGRTSTSYGYYNSNGNKFNNNTGSAYGASYGSGDVIGVAFDADNGTLTFYKNGASQGTAYSSIPSRTYFPCISTFFTSATQSTNFGQRPFAYTAPSGFKALCTANLPAPVVTKPSEYMDVALWAGDATPKSITGLEFSPDMVWYKERSSTSSHAIVDAVRGQTNAARVIYPDRTDAEAIATSTQSVTSLDANGFSIGSDASINESGQTYVAWTWDAGSSTVTNNDGSISSQVRANPSAGFSIVSYTVPTGLSTGTYISIGHGLNVLPGLIILKERNNVDDWLVIHKDYFSTQQTLFLNQTAAVTGAGNIWGAGITSSVFGQRIGSLSVGGEDCIAYCFAPVNGYTSISSFIANASSDGPFVFCNFRPKFLIVKNATRAGGWMLLDASRDPYNVASNFLEANDSDAEVSTQPRVDFLSNGFKVRAPGTYTPNEVSGDTYIYAAFAESPFQYARAR